MLPLDLQSESFSTFIQLLAVAVVTAGGAFAALGVLLAVRMGRKQTDRAQVTWFHKVGSAVLTGVMLGVAIVHGVAWDLIMQSDSHLQLDLAVLMLTAVLGLTACQILRANIARLGPRRRGGVMFLMSVVQLAGLIVCLQSFLETPTGYGPPPTPGQLVANNQWLAQTDSGQIIQLHRREVSPEEFATFITKTRSVLEGMARHAMFRADPQYQSNCHGWVFTGGKHIVQGGDVLTILSENRYTRVLDPQMGDLVVYRHRDQSVVHTGVVSGFLNHQVILIESKWGMDGTYVHQVDDQPYSQDFEFYRSPRSNHLLHLLPADAMASNFDD